MSALLELILQGSADQIDFSNDALEQAFEAQNAAHVKMAEAVIVVERAAEQAGIDITEVATSVVSISAALGKPWREQDAAGRQKLQSAFGGLFSHSDPAVEAAMEALFDGHLANIDANLTLNEWVATNLPDAPPPPPPVEETRRRKG